MIFIILLSCIMHRMSIVIVYKYIVQRFNRRHSNYGCLIVSYFFDAKTIERNRNIIVENI